MDALKVVDEIRILRAELVELRNSNFGLPYHECLVSRYSCFNASDLSEPNKLVSITFSAKFVSSKNGMIGAHLAKGKHQPVKFLTGTHRLADRTSKVNEQMES